MFDWWKRLNNTKRVAVVLVSVIVMATTFAVLSAGTACAVLGSAGLGGVVGRSLANQKQHGDPQISANELDRMQAAEAQARIHSENLKEQLATFQADAKKRIDALKVSLDEANKKSEDHQLLINTMQGTIQELEEESIYKQQQLEDLIKNAEERKAALDKREEDLKCKEETFNTKLEKLEKLAEGLESKDSKIAPQTQINQSTPNVGQNPASSQLSSRASFFSDPHTSKSLSPRHPSGMRRVQDETQNPSHLVTLRECEESRMKLKIPLTTSTFGNAKGPG